MLGGPLQRAGLAIGARDTGNSGCKEFAYIGSFQYKRMTMRNQSERPLTIEVPPAHKDKPPWVKVGVIAAVGFVIGIAWPRLAGVHIGPNAPSETAAAASAAAAHGGRAPDAPPASVSAKLGMPAPSAAPPPSAPAAPVGAAAPPVIVVARGMVLSCVTSDGEKKKGRDCGGVPGIDEIVRPRMKKIANCSGIEGQTGKFSLTANADFVSGRFYYDVNKASSTVQNFDAVVACLKTGFHNTAVVATPHEHAKYTVVYTAQLTAPEPEKAVARADKDAKDTKAKTEPEEKPAPEKDKPSAPSATTGEAEVSWDVGLVRDSPKTGALVSRLPRGTKVKVGASKDGWYQIKFGDNFATEGWVYRGAIGR